MKFQNKNTDLFFDELNKKVAAHFTIKNIDRFANRGVLIKAVLLVLMYFGSYALLLSGKFNTTQSIILLVLMGITAVMIVFNIVHDASHKSLFKNQSLNKAVVYLGDLVGMNSYIWNIRHNMQHHSFTNIVGGDILLDNIPLLRVSPYQKKLWFHRFQSGYAPLLYAVYSIFWVFFLDLSFFLRKKMGNLKNIRHSRAEWLKLFSFKSVYIIYMIIIPWLILKIPAGTVLTGFLIYHVAAGLLLSMVVVLGHCVEGPQYVAPDENDIIQNSWMQHEWDTTSDCATDSRIMHWITGGLNTHIAHHLFPKICHCHYYEITKIIKKHCAGNNVHYPHHNFVNAIISHFKFLNRQANSHS